tara:strand:+ start:4755 stop:7040 length:2286 start_codon:yes stop_codon:yes gene_type:complete
MAMFNGKKEYEVVKEGDEIILRIDYESHTLPPSIEDNSQCMSRTIDILSQLSGVTKIIFSQKRDYEYNYKQTQFLMEIANVYRKISKQGLVQYQVFLTPGYERYATSWFSKLQHIMHHTIKHDPLGAYVELKRLLRREELDIERSTDEGYLIAVQKYLSILKYLIKEVENTQFIQTIHHHLAGFKPGDRTLYTRIFSPLVKPDFMNTRLMAAYPQHAEELESYKVEDTDISLFALPDSTLYLYHMMPPEFRLTEEKYELLDAARKIMAEHQPKQQEFVDPERMRQVFSNVGSDLLDELSAHHGVKLKEKEVEQLTNILVRYSVGFGLIEILIQDERIQDITMNSPMGQIPIFIVHQDYDNCQTNVVPTRSEAESWASKLRLISGRPLDEANPILDTELTLPGGEARVAVIAPPLNPTGLGYALRRHRDKPWTLPLFIKTKMVTNLAAGVLDFLIDGSRTMLVAGTRSAGKTSLLGSLLVEIMRRYRIITIEDTLELPTVSLRKLGFNVQPMKVAAAMAKGSAEVSAADGIRTTLRLGDSALIVGEVRSQEAAALYEAMRVGALANVVAGTIHGDSPYGVFDRVVNDLKVPRTSFKATDVIVVCNPVKSADGLHRWRRVTSITEIRKEWETDPLRENGFVDLLKYDATTDELAPSNDLINGESEILKSIAGNVKEWAGNWDAVWDNIQLRAKLKQGLVDMAEKSKNDDILEAKFSIMAKDEFHRLTEKISNETGALDSKRLYTEWESWLKHKVKKWKPEENG